MPSSMKLTCHIVYLKNKYTFRIAHGSREGLETLIVELSDGPYTGYGEAAPVPYYGFTAQSLKELLESHRDIIENYDLQSAEEFWEYMKPHIGHWHFAQCALDIAAHDLVAQKAQLPLYKYWGLSVDKIPNSNYTIGIDSIEQMVEKMKEEHFPIYKIKLGTPHDIEIVKELRKHTEAIFRVDANTAWGVEETIRNAEAFEKLGVEFIEQPMKPDNWKGMKEAMKSVKLPLTADESCIVESDVDRCVGYFHGINIKLAKCGGLTPARRMIARARQLNLKVMVGCMSESSIGISAIGQLLPLIDYVDMDGALLISNDPADGVKVRNGKAIFPDRNGIGAFLKK